MSTHDQLKVSVCCDGPNEIWRGDISFAIKISNRSSDNQLQYYFKLYNFSFEIYFFSYCALTALR